MPEYSLRANLRALPRPAWILFGGTFVNRFGMFVLPFLVIYLTRRGYRTSELGWDGRVMEVPAVLVPVSIGMRLVVPVPVT